MAEPEAWRYREEDKTEETEMSLKELQRCTVCSKEDQRAKETEKKIENSYHSRRAGGESVVSPKTPQPEAEEGRAGKEVVKGITHFTGGGATSPEPTSVGHQR